MAYCGKCGKYVPNDVFKCPNCGAISRRGAKKSVIPLLLLFHGLSHRANWVLHDGPKSL